MLRAAIQPQTQSQRSEPSETVERAAHLRLCIPDFDDAHGLIALGDDAGTITRYKPDLIIAIALPIREP